MPPSRAGSPDPREVAASVRWASASWAAGVRVGQVRSRHGLHGRAIRCPKGPSVAFAQDAQSSRSPNDAAARRSIEDFAMAEPDRVLKQAFAWYKASINRALGA